MVHCKVVTHAKIIFSWPDCDKSFLICFMNVLKGIYYVLQLVFKYSRTELGFFCNKNQSCWCDVPAKAELNVFDAFLSLTFDI